MIIYRIQISSNDKIIGFLEIEQGDELCNLLDTLKIFQDHHPNVTFKLL